MSDWRWRLMEIEREIWLMDAYGWKWLKNWWK